MDIRHLAKLGCAGVAAIAVVAPAGPARAAFPGRNGKLAVSYFDDPGGGAGPARSGIGLTVVKSNAVVVPARVFGTFEAYGRDVRIPRPHPISVKYGKPMRFEALRKEAQTCSKARLKEIYREIADEIMGVIAKLEPHEDKESFP